MHQETPTGAITTFKASDPQGIEVGATPTIDNVTLTKGKTYQMKIEVRNSIGNEDITAEILEEADEHQFLFFGYSIRGIKRLNLHLCWSNWRFTRCGRQSSGGAKPRDSTMPICGLSFDMIWIKLPGATKSKFWRTLSKLVERLI